MAVVRSHEQPEYGPRQRHAPAHGLIDRLLLASDVAPVEIDTRLHPGDPLLCSHRGQLESALARFDVVVTTRLRGLVLALKVGVPALAVDPVAGGAKVIRQSEALGWHAAVRIEDAGAARLQELLAWCLTARGAPNGPGGRRGGCPPAAHHPTDSSPLCQARSRDRRRGRGARGAGGSAGETGGRGRWAGSGWEAGRGRPRNDAG